MNQVTPSPIGGGVLIAAAAALVIAASERKDPALILSWITDPSLKTKSGRNRFRMDGAMFRSSCAADTLWVQHQRTAEVTPSPYSLTGRLRGEETEDDYWV